MSADSRSKEDMNLATQGNSTSEMAKSIRRSTGSYELVAGAGLLGLLGFGLDSWFGYLPLFTAIFSVAGFLGAGISIYYRYKHAMSLHGIHRRKANAGSLVGGGADSVSNMADK